MNDLEEAIRLQKEIKEQIGMAATVAGRMCNGAVSAYIRAEEQFRQNKELMEAFSYIRKELRAYYTVQEVVGKEVAKYINYSNDILKEYHAVANVTRVVQQIQESLQPMRDYVRSVQPMLQDSPVMAQLAEIRKQVILRPEIISELQRTLEAYINTSVWEYDTEEEEIDYVEDELQSDILELTEADDKPGAVKQFLVKWGEKGKKVLIDFVKSIITAFFSGLIAFCFEPVYKVMVPSICLLEEDAKTKNTVEIPVNTEIHVWNDITNNIIEITYKIDEVEHQGYITKEELSSNTELISDEIELEHIMFINEVTQVLSDSWMLSPERVYSFLKDDTNLLNDYLLKHYEVLSVLDVDSFVVALEAYCEAEGIVLPATN